VYSKKTHDDGQRNCPKYVEFYSKNKFEELVHLVGFIIRSYGSIIFEYDEVCGLETNLSRMHNIFLIYTNLVLVLSCVTAL